MIVRFLLVSNHWIHLILTPFIFISIIFIAQMLLWGQNWREQTRWWHPILLFILFWLFIPDFGGAILWRTGAGNYCYTTFFALLFLIPFRMLIAQPTWTPSKKIQTVLPFLGILAGWSNENLGITVFLAATTATVYTGVASGEWPRWPMIACFSALAGWLILILAPGNYIRLANPAFDEFHKSSFLQKLTNYFYWWIKFQNKIIPLTCIIILGLYCTSKKSSIFDITVIAAVAIFIMAQISISAFILSILPPGRALTASSILLCISAFFFLVASSVPRTIKYASCFLLIVFFSFSIVSNISLFQHNHAITLEREKILTSYKNCVLPRYIHSAGSHPITTRYADFDVSWVNTPAKLFYDVDSISLQEPKVLEKCVFTDGKNKFFIEKNDTGEYILLSKSDSDTTEHKIYYERKINSLYEIQRYIFRYLYSLFNIQITPTQKELTMLYESKIMHHNKPIKYVYPIHGSVNDIKYISYTNTFTEETVYLKKD